MSSSRHHYCEICQKNYSSRQSLFRHKKNIHDPSSEKSTKSKPFQEKSKPKVNQNDYNGHPKVNMSKLNEGVDVSYLFCKYCNKKYKFKQSKSRHEKKCPKKEDMDSIKKEYDVLKQELLKLIKRNCKIHPNTLKKMCRDNNITIDNSIINNNQQITNNNQRITNNNQQITNNVQILTFGYEGDAIHEALTKKDKIKILKSGRGSLLQLVKHVHFNDDLPQFKNFAITNLNNPYAYRYNSDKNQFLACTKDELLEELIDMRTMDIDEFYNTYENHIDDNKKRAIQELIKDMEDFEGKEYSEMKHQFKFLVYNSTKSTDVSMIE
jgi:hypothetical protein